MTVIVDKDYLPFGCPSRRPSGRPIIARGSRGPASGRASVSVGASVGAVQSFPGRARGEVTGGGPGLGGARGREGRCSAPGVGGGRTPGRWSGAVDGARL